jgi:hypothetical protein
VAVSLGGTTAVSSCRVIAIASALQAMKAHLCDQELQMRQRWFAAATAVKDEGYAAAARTIWFDRRPRSLTGSTFRNKIAHTHQLRANTAGPQVLPRFAPAHQPAGWLVSKVTNGNPRSPATGD